MVREGRIDPELFGKQEIDVPLINAFYRHRPFPKTASNKVGCHIPRTGECAIY